MRLSILALALIGLLACAACGGGTSAISANDNLDGTGSSEAIANSGENPASLGSGLAAMPSPREVSDASELDESTRSYLMRMGTFYSGLKGQGSETLFPERYLRLDPMSEELVPYDFAMITRVRTADTKLCKVSVEFTWEGDEPADGNGVFIGFADTDTDRWVWRGPITSSADMVDFSDLGFETSSDEWRFEDILAMVNYSSTPVVIKRIFYTKVDANDTKGDEYLYYATTSMDDFSEQIHRAPANALEEDEVIFSTNPFESIGRMQAVNIDGEDLLIFNRFTQLCKWETWQMGIDGSNPQVRKSIEFGDIQFSSFSEDMTKEFFLVNNWSSNNMLQEFDVATGEMLTEYDMLATNISNPLWYNRGKYNCRMMFTLPETSGSDTWGLVSYINADHLGGGILYLERMMESGESIVDPFCFDWALRDGALMEYYLYSYKANPDDNYSIVLYDRRGQTPREKELVSMEGYDLRYPEMSPDQLNFSVVATPKWGTYGTLYVMPAFAMTMDESFAVADNVSSVMWYDPTPPVWED